MGAPVDRDTRSQKTRFGGNNGRSLWEGKISHQQAAASCARSTSLKVTTTSQNTCKKVCPTFVSDFQSLTRAWTRVHWYSVYTVQCTWPRLTSYVCLTSNNNHRYDLDRFSIYSQHPSWLFHFTGISGHTVGYVWHTERQTETCTQIYLTVWHVSHVWWGCKDGANSWAYMIFVHALVFTLYSKFPVVMP